MNQFIKPRSRIPIRPNTFAGLKGDEDAKKEIEVQFTSQNRAESVTDVNDVFATGDATEDLPNKDLDHTAQIESGPKKIPLFKQSMINCSLIETRKAPIAPPKKYVPNYQRELGQYKERSFKPRKRISIPDELKSLGDEPFPECGLAEQITEDIKKQLEELKRDSSADNVADRDFKQKFEALIEPSHIQNMETRLTFLEQKLESLIELLYASQTIKNPELAIKIEEYNLERLNTRLRVHQDPKTLPEKNSARVASDDSEPNLFKEILYETRQKKLNLAGKSEESLKFNKVPVLQRSGLAVEPTGPKYMNMFKQIGKLSRVEGGNV